MALKNRFPHVNRDALRTRLPAVGAAAALAAIATVGATGATAPSGDAKAALVLSPGDAAAQEQVSLARRSAQGDAARVLAERQQAAASRSAARERDRRLTEARKIKEAKAKKTAKLKAEKAAKAAAAKKAAALASAQSDPKSAAQSLLGDYGFDASQFSCLVTLWEGESNWNYQARNPSSGAFGIPQALPANKYNTVGTDWQTNPVTQMKWGLQYIKDVYGSPCGALNAWQARSPHWY